MQYLSKARPDHSSHCLECDTWVRPKLYARTGGYCKTCFHEMQQVVLVRDCIITFTNGTDLRFPLTEEEFESESVTSARIMQEIEREEDVTLEDVESIQYGDWRTSDANDYLENYED